MQEWRKKNVQLAIARDNGQCVFCWFLDGAKVAYEQVHHVYSRDRVGGEWREHYTNMLCTCQRHHPQPIIFPGASKGLGWVEDVARQANEHPINSKFVHMWTGVIDGKD